MNRSELLQEALNAVGLQKSHASNQLDMAKSINSPELVRHWQQEHDRHQNCYRELFAWLVELKQHHS